MNTSDALSFPSVTQLPAKKGGRTQWLKGVAWVLCLQFFLSGCETPPAATQTQPQGKPQEVFTLQEGDVIKISFPGAPNFDSTQTIRRDGKVTLGLVGEVLVIGRTPVELEQDLLKLYSSQLVSREVTVMVVSSTYPVFVSGAVLSPGKIQADRPLTVLEAIMEAGGFSYSTADTKAVKLIRQEGGGTKNYTINLKRILDGESSEPFYVKRSDIIFVPEKFSWF